MKLAYMGLTSLVSILLLSGCAPKPEKLQDNLEISLNLSLNQQKAPSKFPQNPEELKADDWTYSVVAQKYRGNYFPVNANVQVKYLAVHATTIVIEGYANDTLDYANYLVTEVGTTANIVELVDENKPKDVVSLIFMKGKGVPK